MPYPSIRKQIEEKYNKPMQVLLPLTATALGSLEAVADAWDVSLTSVWRWAEEIGMWRECYYTIDGSKPVVKDSE